MTDLAANDERRAHAIMERIKCQAAELRSSKSSSGSNVLSQATFHIASQCTDSQNNIRVSILDPKSWKLHGNYGKKPIGLNFKKSKGMLVY